MGIIIFNGVSSKDIGLEVETFPTYKVPEKEYSVYHVPGRNGDIITSTGSYKPTTRSYMVSIATWDLVPYSTLMSRVSQWLNSSTGYARLEDSYDPEVYRMGYYAEMLEFENLFNEAGKAKLNFNVKPQRFYKKGELPVTFTSSALGHIQNETINDALPLLKITHSTSEDGAIAIGSYVVGISKSANSPLYIDCDLQDAYSYSSNVLINENSKIVLNGGSFPKLVPGLIEIYCAGGVSSVEITPRWWSI